MVILVEMIDILLKEKTWKYICMVKHLFSQKMKVMEELFGGLTLLIAESSE